MKKKTHSFIMALTVAWTLGLASQIAHAQDKVYPSPPLPVAMPRHVAGPTGPLVQIQLVILETMKGKCDEITDTISQFFPDADVSQSIFRLGDEKTGVADRLVRELTQANLARIISRPQIMTASGRKATVQVGQQVKLPPTEDPNDDETREIGLTIECLPKVVDGDLLHLEMNVGHATVNADRVITVKGVEYPVINEQRMSSTVQTKSLETLVIRKAAGADSLLILIHPRLHPPTVRSAYAPLAKSKLATSTPPSGSQTASDVMGNLQRITNAMNAVAPDLVQDLSLQGTEFQIQAVFDSVEQINEVVDALGKIHSIEMKKVRVDAQGDKTQFEAVGRIKQAMPVVERRLPADRYTATVTKSQASPEFMRLQASIRELFPEEKILIRQLNQSVLLRGTVSERTMPIIVSVAEDFFPSVINDLVVGDKPKQPRTIPIAAQQTKHLADEVRRLRDDVQSLRADIQKIIELLQTHRSGTPETVGRRR